MVGEDGGGRFQEDETFGRPAHLVAVKVALVKRVEGGLGFALLERGHKLIQFVHLFAFALQVVGIVPSDVACAAVCKPGDVAAEVLGVDELLGAFVFQCRATFTKHQVFKRLELGPVHLAAALAPAFAPGFERGLNFIGQHAVVQRHHAPALFQQPQVEVDWVGPSAHPNVAHKTAIFVHHITWALGGTQVGVEGAGQQTALIGHAAQKQAQRIGARFGLTLSVLQEQTCSSQRLAFDGSGCNVQLWRIHTLQAHRDLALGVDQFVVFEAAIGFLLTPLVGRIKSGGGHVHVRSRHLHFEAVLTHADQKFGGVGVAFAVRPELGHLDVTVDLQIDDLVHGVPPDSGWFCLAQRAGSTQLL